MTVVLASHNGAGTLPRVLDGYAALGTSFAWNMIVVDNASTDGTAEIVESYASRLPVTLLSEEQPGKNRALNKAIEQELGAFVIFTDDDAVPEEGFLSAWRETARNAAEYDLFGARIDAEFLQPPPSWLSSVQAHFPEIYATNDRAEGSIQAADIFGPNMAVRRRVLDSGHRFDEGIGPTARNANYGMGSETEFCTRMESQGYRAWFTRGPRVRHLVRPNQMTREFVFRRAYRHGLGFGMRTATANRHDAAGDGTTRQSVRAKILDMALDLGASVPVGPVSDRSNWQRSWRKGFRDGLAMRSPESGRVFG
jgi:glycosyltransferase involved in cell wall biosynthesis